jgi:fatty-acyl-CoA synthase
MSSHLDVSHLQADTSQRLLDCSLGDLLRRNAAEVPDRIALVEGIADATRC